MRITPTTNAMTARMRKSRPVPVDTHDDDSRDRVASVRAGVADLSLEGDVTPTVLLRERVLGGLPPLPNEALSHIAVFIDEGLLRHEAEYRLKEE